MAPGTFSILPGSHHAGDSYARKVGPYASAWDSGVDPGLPVSEVHFKQGSKTVLDVFSLASEDLFHSKQIKPGDVFISNQSAVHGLKAEGGKNFFLAVTVVPSPVAASTYGFTRTEYVERVIASIVSSSAVEWQLSKLKKVSADEVLFTGYKFSDEDLGRLASQGGWNDCFGLRFIEEERWKQTFNANKHLAIQRLQDDL